MRSVICFGTGLDGQTFISIAENKIKIEYFLDNVRSGQIDRFKIYKPSMENCVGKYIVVTTSMYYQSIKRQLEGYGLCERIDFVSVIEFLMSNYELLNKDLAKDKLKLHLFLRKRKAASCALQQLVELPEKTDLIFETYQNAVIFPLKNFPEDNLLCGRGGVVEQSGQYVKLSGMKDRIDGKYDFGDPQYRDERVVYCGYLVGHWGHFLTEVIARLWYFLENDNALDKYVFFVGRGAQNVNLEGNYKEFFRLLGILEKIEIINEPVQYKEVIVPQLCYKRTHYCSMDYKKIFSTIIASAMQECREQQFYSKVFFTRSGWSKAEFGLDMLDDFFEKNGFKVISPETLSLTRMIYILQKADTVAAVSGTTAHNILFGKDGQELIIIERCSTINPVQTDINKIKQLDVTHIDANMSLFPVSYGNGPFLLSCNKFLKNFAEERKWDLPERGFMSETYVKDNIKLYIDYYNKRRNIAELYRFNNAVLREAYMDDIREIKNHYFDLSNGIENMEATFAIPLHNCEKFITECIHSVMSYTIGDIEILCNNEKDLDVSFDITKELQKEDNRIVHICDENIDYEHKPSTGISMTIGKYSVDFKADDKSCAEMVEKMYDIALDNDADIIGENYGEVPWDNNRVYDSVMQINIQDIFLFRVYV